MGGTLVVGPGRVGERRCNRHDHEQPDRGREPDCAHDPVSIAESPLDMRRERAYDVDRERYPYEAADRPHLENPIERRAVEVRRGCATRRRSRWRARAARHRNRCGDPIAAPDREDERDRERDHEQDRRQDAQRPERAPRAGDELDISALPREQGRRPDGLYAEPERPVEPDELALAATKTAGDGREVARRVRELVVQRQGPGNRQRAQRRARRDRGVAPPWLAAAPPVARRRRRRPQSQPRASPRRGARRSNASGSRTTRRSPHR